jgi:hypothetical protein
LLIENVLSFTGSQHRLGLPRSRAPTKNPHRYYGFPIDCLALSILLLLLVGTAIEPQSIDFFGSLIDVHSIKHLLLPSYRALLA